MVMKRFDPALLRNLDAFRLAAGQHGSSGLGLAFSKNIGSGIGGMYEDLFHAPESWFFERHPLAVPRRYLNPGFDERLHCAIDRAGLPERFDNHPNRVFGLWVVVILTVRAFNPTDRQCGNHGALLGFGHSRVGHMLGSFLVFVLRKSRCDLR